MPEIADLVFPCKIIVGSVFAPVPPWSTIYTAEALTGESSVASPRIEAKSFFIYF